MPKTVVSYRYVAGTNGYFTDTNTELSVTGRFVLPPDLTEANRDAILTAMGATLNTESAPCSDTGLGDLRKLEFIREGGNSMSAAVSVKDNILTVASTIKGVLDAANSGNNRVVCIKLTGEYFANLNDEFGVSYDGTTFATSHKAPATALKQNFASGVIAYEADAANPVGSTVTHSIKSITDKDTNEFATQLGTVAAGCVGDFLDLQNCGNGRRNPRKHRRFLLTFATKINPADTAEAASSETIELPVKGGGALDIQACGNNAAGLTGLYCLGYRGESYSRIHKLL